MGKTSLGQAVTADSDGDGCKRNSAAAAARITPISDQLRANARTADQLRAGARTAGSPSNPLSFSRLTKQYFKHSHSPVRENPAGSRQGKTLRWDGHSLDLETNR